MHRSSARSTSTCPNTIPLLDSTAIMPGPPCASTKIARRYSSLSSGVLIICGRLPAQWATTREQTKIDDNLRNNPILNFNSPPWKSLLVSHWWLREDVEVVLGDDTLKSPPTNHLPTTYTLPTARPTCNKIKCKGRLQSVLHCKVSQCIHSSDFVPWLSTSGERQVAANRPILGLH